MKNFLHEDTCPIRDILSRLGDKWSLLVLTTLNANGTMRFSDIQKSIGDISRRMLTVTLRSLEADGLVVRKIYPEVPPRVEYYLSKSGHTLMPHLDNLVEWAIENMQDIMKSRQNYN
jgi:DNA-binding HxlR family transcriptional regulator